MYHYCTEWWFVSTFFKRLKGLSGFSKMKTFLSVFNLFAIISCVCGQSTVHSCSNKNDSVLVAARSDRITIGCYQTSLISSCSISKSGFQLCSSSACIEDERISFTGGLTEFTSCQFELKQLEVSGIKFILILNASGIVRIS